MTSRRPRNIVEGAEASGLWGLCRPVIEAAPLPMAAVEGPEHRVRSVNPAFCRLIEAAREAVIGRPFVEAVPAWAGSQALLDRVSRPAGAAAQLGLKPTTLESRIKKLGLQRPR